MFASIKHIAICTENYDRMAKFYKTIFDMKKITNGMTDASGNYNPERGHISDGLIGYALLQRQPVGQTHTFHLTVLLRPYAMILRGTMMLKRKKFAQSCQT